MHMYCPNCGASVPDGARFCSDCGHPLGATDGSQSDTGRTTPDYQTKVYVNKKSEGLALVLSLLLPGLGEIYLGRIGRGIALMAVYLMGGIFATVWLIAAFDDGGAMLAGTLIWAIPVAVWIYAMYDSYMLAKRYNEYLISHDGNPPPKE